MDNDAGAVRIKARFSDILAKGSSNYTIKEVRSDVKVNKKLIYYYLIWYIIATISPKMSFLQHWYD